ncbi:similar to kynurenine 3-monooxygenase [Plenodomus lingam JN3]|uniref:Kynurenine 3-monooxygenase n=1 Tax=Leptosphaeria maculans (strain JN3 / isolate v23.1.3 / race Av1-4-5-6-7-8) TaxID=985895 RepID=E4ZUU2_LEPMJ|nr:similar to kynurenine 3-monooxygenase [Plenodomus lingam JN3]CBX95171.1 similar to kynurenine 3-monooxygenase [Plenodomus lingam JN3]
MPQKVVVVGAGPVGSLAAIYAAVRGHDVEVYELRADIRQSPSTSLSFSKSINLALSERGINSLRQAGLSELEDAVLSQTFPMQGRMIHVRKNGEYIRQSQQYDARGRSLLAMDRTELSKTLLDHLEAMPNVKLIFNHKLVGVDFNKKIAWFEYRPKSIEQQGNEFEINFDLMIGADGAHSAVRYQLMKFVPMSFEQEYIDKLWCQFHVPPSSTGDFRIPPNYLHIWPQDESMFIALPNLDKTFTATLFLTRDGFEQLDASGKVVEYFARKFPGVVPELISEDELRKQYATNQHLPLISIKCSPYHYGASGVIVGDSAHAMVPFYGQGMNAGMEDVRVLFGFLDKHSSDWSKALCEYTKERAPDAQAINDLALGNYREMASDVKKPLYLLRKWIEEQLYVYAPSLGWATQYSRVTFSNMRYSEVRLATQRQAQILNGLVGFALASMAGSAFWFAKAGGAHKAKMGILRSICVIAQRLQKVVKG